VSVRQRHLSGWGVGGGGGGTRDPMGAGQAVAKRCRSCQSPSGSANVSCVAGSGSVKAAKWQCVCGAVVCCRSQGEAGQRCVVGCRVVACEVRVKARGGGREVGGGGQAGQCVCAQQARQVQQAACVCKRVQCSAGNRA